MWSTNDLRGNMNTSIEELKNKLLTTNLELESAKSLLLQERTKNHESVKHLLKLLRSAWQERDEAQKQRDEARNELQSLLNKILAPKPMTPSYYDHHDNHLPDFTNFEESDNDIFYNIAPAKDHNHNRCSFSSSSPPPLSSPSPCSPSVAMTDRLIVEGKKALPEKGRLLQAVVEAGPLLQTLLLEPIPQWKNPPPMPRTLPLPTNSFPISPFSSPAAEAGAEISDHVPQMPPLSSSPCLDTTKQMINSGSGVVKYQMGKGESSMLSDYVGEALFQTHENLEHLAMMVRVLGPQPQHMAFRADCRAEKYFRRGSRLDWPDSATSRESMRAVWELPHLPGELPHLPNLILQHVDHSAGDLIDLLQGLLRYDPAVRLKAREAQRHPFFTRDMRRG